MITTEDLTTKVQFGSNGIGTIGIVIKNETLPNTITLHQLVDGEFKIGAPIEDDHVKELPKIQLVFSDSQSINSLVKALLFLKEKMDYPYGTYPLAC